MAAVLRGRRVLSPEARLTAVLSELTALRRKLASGEFERWPYLDPRDVALDIAIRLDALLILGQGFDQSEAAS